MKQLIVLAADHNGVELKTKVKEYLKENGILPVDLGPYDTTQKVDYVDYADQLSNIVSHGDASKGILICGTGVGMSIAANRHEKVRAALIHNQFTAPRSREHNDSNVLCLGSWVTSYEQVKQILDFWLETNYGEGRHVKRVEKLSKTKGKKIVFTNGVFDIIHTGHIELLRFAKSLGNKLVVGINSDRAVKELKGASRPINAEDDRKKVLESLDMVDEVVIFDNIDPRNVRETLSPDVFVKGGEWTEKEVRKRDNVSDHTTIKICPLVANYSTTEIIKKVKSKKT